MAIHVALTHETRYRYAQPASLGPQVVRLRPAPHSRARRILSYSLSVEPAEHFLNWQQDPLGNYPRPHRVCPTRRVSFALQVDLVAEMTVFNPFDFFLEPEAEKFPFAYEPRMAKELEPYLRTRAGGAACCRLGRAASIAARRRTIDFLVELNQRLHHEVDLRDPHGARRADAARRR